MRREMRNMDEQTAIREKMNAELSARNEQADRLLEKWEKTAEIGDGIKDLRAKNENKARALAFVLENEEAHLSKLTETQISSAFQTTPENVLRIVRLAYPNSVRGDLFLEWGMETARDSIYYLHPVYGSTKNGGVKGSQILATAEGDYASEVTSVSLGTGDASTTDFTGDLGTNVIRPYTVIIFTDGTPVASDNGSGVIMGSGVSGTVDYTTGAVTVKFTTAPASGAAVSASAHVDTEVEAAYPTIGSIELQLKDYQFRVTPRPLYISWSKMTELLLNTTLNIDAEEALIRGAGDEFKKALDFEAVGKGWGVAKGHTAVTFDCKGATGEAEVDRMAAFSKAIDKAGDIIYNALLRGGVTKMVGGTDAINQIMLHPRFDATGKQPKVGIYRVGSIDGVDIYKAPNQIIPTDEIMTIYKNELVPEDVSIAFGTLIPLYRTQTLEYKELYKESGLAQFGDAKVLMPEYLQRIKLLNL